jgi:uncharacterized LabA/DUF88 family protein
VSVTRTLFVDGSNLYSAQYSLFGPGKYIDFTKFIHAYEAVARVCFDRIYFYASYTPRSSSQTPEQHAFSKNEFLFYKSAKAESRIVFFTGYRSATSGKEKEVDVKLAADMVYSALTGSVRHMELLTGDADFLQALKLIKSHTSDIKISLLCIENRVMYRGSFEFPTTLVSFDTQKKFSRLPRNIVHRCIPSSSLIQLAQEPTRRTIKKAPRSLVRGKDIIV